MTRRIALATVGLLLLLCGALAWLLLTETGAQFLWRQAAPRLAPMIEIDELSGRLAGPLRVHGLRVRSAQLDADLRRAELAWSPLALLAGIGQVQYLRVDGLRLEIRADDSEPQPPPPTLPSLPRFILLWADLHALEIHSGAQVHQIERLRFSGHTTTTRISLAVGILSLPGLGHFNAELRAYLEPTRIRLANLRLRQSSGGADIAARGQCAWPELLCEGEAEWAQLGWPLVEPVHHSPKGDVRFAGSAELFELQLQGQFLTPGLPPLHVEAGTSGHRGGLEQLSLEAVSEAGRVQLQGRIGWADALHYALTVQGRELRPEHFAADWPGQLAVDARIDGDAETLRLESATVKGALRDYPVDIDAAASLHSSGRADIRSARARIGRNRLQLSGQLGREAIDLAVDLRAPELAALWPGLEGALRANGRLAGAPAQPRWQGEIGGEKLGYGGLHLARVQARGRLDLQPQGALDLKLELAGLAGETNLLDSAALKLAGKPQAWTLDSRLTAAGVDFEARARGALDWTRRSLRAELRSASLRPPGLPAWRLSGTQKIVADGAAVRLHQGCWTGTGSLCLQGGWQNGMVDAEVQLRDLDLADYAGLIPPKLELSGQLAARLTLQPAPPDRPSGDFLLEAQGLALSTREEELEDLPRLAFRKARLDGRLTDGTLAASLNLELPEGAIRGTARVGLADTPRPLQMQLSAGLDELGWLALLHPEVVAASGRLRAELQAGGQLEAPQWSGEARLENGSLQLDRPGILLQAVDGELRLFAADRGQFELRGRSGDGQVTLSGELEPGPTLKARLQGRDFRVIDTAEAVASVTPDLVLRADSTDIVVNGRIAVPHARIRPRRLNDTGVQRPSSDQRLVGAETAAAERRLSSLVTVELGKDVRFEGFGLKTGIRGALITEQQPGKLPVGRGELRLVDGQYKAYGQDLTVERGLLIFSGGPLSRPGIDLRAYRRPQPGILVGLEVRGPADAPEFSVYSDPSMGETDQLSYLVLGRAARARSSEDRAAVNNAALALGLKGGDFLAKRVKSRLSLDEVSIGARPGETAEQAALVLGKYLTPRLYVSYGIGLFEPVHSWRLNYQLSRQLSLETETAVESGGDLFYTIEW